jgi:single-strand DNA-binding protein
MQESPHPYVNEVLLVGRLSGEPIVRPLPSSDLVLEWRLLVDRPPDERRTARNIVDTFSCVSYDGRLLDVAEDWRHGDLIEVRGTLRHRFWRTGNRHEIVVKRARLRVPPSDRARKEALPS